MKEDSARVCMTCRHWSEHIVRPSERGLEAYCLGGKSPNRNSYTRGRNSCAAWVSFLTPRGRRPALLTEERT